MKKEPTPDSFVIRIWREGDPPRWRGWVQHVRSGEVLLTDDLNELIAFLERWSGELVNPARRGLK